MIFFCYIDNLFEKAWNSTFLENVALICICTKYDIKFRIFIPSCPLIISATTHT